MTFFKNFLIGVGAFSVIILSIIGVKALFVDLFMFAEETVSMIIMGVVLLFIAPMFGELTASVFKLNRDLNK